MLDLRDYLCRNQFALRNYAQDRRNGLRISSALAESAMSHLVNERMGKTPADALVSRGCPMTTSPMGEDGSHFGYALCYRLAPLS